MLSHHVSLPHPRVLDPATTAFVSRGHRQKERFARFTGFCSEGEGKWEIKVLNEEVNNAMISYKSHNLKEKLYGIISPPGIQ